MIAIDTNVFIYHLEGHPHFGGSAGELLSRVESGKLEAVSSVISFAEILTLPAGAGDRVLVQRYRVLLLKFPHLTFVNTNPEIAEAAAEIHGDFPQLKLMDAIIVATATLSKAEALISEDKRLRTARKRLPVVTVAEFLS